MAKTLESWQTEDAQRLKALWLERAGDISQAEFGAAQDIGNQGAVWQYLNGKIPLNLYAAARFAHGLGVSLRDLSPHWADELQRLVLLSGCAQEAIQLPATSADTTGSNIQEDGTVMIEITHQGERPADDIELLRKLVSLWAGGTGADAPAVVIRRGGELIPPATQVRRRGGKPAEPVHEMTSRGRHLTDRDDKNR